MGGETDRSRLVGEDYADEARLAARQAIYAWQEPKVDLVGQVLDRLASLGGSVIDAGCGNGVYTSALRPHRPDLRVVGMDLSPGMRPDVIADAQRLPLPDRGTAPVRPLIAATTASSSITGTTYGTSSSHPTRPLQLVMSGAGRGTWFVSSGQF